MALTAPQEQRMQSIKLDKFLEANKTKYKAMATDAYEFTAKMLKPTKQHVRPDDVSGHLHAGIELDEQLKVYLTKALKGRAVAGRWANEFTFLILDRVWEELEREHQPSGD